MELKPGYKLTEVGSVPVDWLIKPIGALRPFITSGSRGWASFYSEYGFPFVRITNLSRDSIFLDLCDLKFVTLPPGENEGRRTQLENNDVLISITADIGIVGYVSGDVPQPSYINQHIALVRFDRTTIQPKFVCYFLASEKSQRRFRALTDSGAKAGMSLITVGDIKLALPPTLAEQEAIAEALSDADALIESLEQLIAKKRHLKQGASQELLTGKKRLPGFSGEWEAKPLGAVAPLQRGFDLPNAKLKQGPYPVVYSNGMLNRHVAFQVKGPGVVTGRSGTIGTVTFVEGDFWPHNTALWVTSFRHNDPKFVFYLYTRIGLERLATGTGVPTLNRNDVHAFRVRTPVAKSEQTAIATILGDMDAEIAALEAKLAKARDVKQGMMQELLTGRIRLVRPTVTSVSYSTPAAEPPSDKSAKSHNPQINEAVVIGVLAKLFGSEKYPIPRKRRVKLTYLLDRYARGVAEGYLKKAAGPYNPATKYKGPEAIAVKNRYVRAHNNGTYEGFIAADHVAQAETYFNEWYGAEALTWIQQFKFKKTEELELLATVDMAMEDLRREGQPVELAAVKQLIRSAPEWTPKLQREIFSDANIVGAIKTCQGLFA